MLEDRKNRIHSLFSLLKKPQVLLVNPSIYRNCFVFFRLLSAVSAIIITLRKEKKEQVARVLSERQGRWTFESETQQQIMMSGSKLAYVLILFLLALNFFEEEFGSNAQLIPQHEGTHASTFPFVAINFVLFCLLLCNCLIDKTLKHNILSYEWTNKKETAFLWGFNHPSNRSHFSNISFSNENIFQILMIQILWKHFTHYAIKKFIIYPYLVLTLFLFLKIISWWTFSVLLVLMAVKRSFPLFLFDCTPPINSHTQNGDFEFIPE